MRKFFLSFILLLMLSMSAWATQITISSTTVPNIQYAGTTATLRIYYSDTFIDSDGTMVVGGAVGSANSYKIVSCTLNSVTHVLSIPSYTIPSTTDSSNPVATVSAVIYDQAGAKRNFIYADWIIPNTLGSVLTIAQLNVAQPRGNTPRPPTTFPTTDQVSVLISNAVTGANAPTANDVRRGILKTSVPPADSTNPIAVSDNDNRLKQVAKRFNVEKNGAVGTDSTDDTAAIIATLAEASAAGGGIVEFPNGAWRTTGGMTVPNGVTIESVGSKESSGCQILLIGNNTYIFKVPDSARNIIFRSVEFKTSGTNDVAILMQGSYPNSTFNISAHYCVFNGFAYGIKIHSLTSPTTWECNIISIEQNHFVGITVAGIYCDTVNSSFFIAHNLFNPAAGADGVVFDQAGPSTIVNNTCNGISGITPECVTGSPNPAESRRFVWINGQHGSITFLNNVTENMQEAVRVSFADYTYPFYVANNQFPDRIVLEADCNWYSSANTYRRVSVKASDDVRIYSNDDQLLNTSGGVHQDDCGAASLVDSPFEVSGGAMVDYEENPTTLTRTIQNLTAFLDPGPSFFSASTPMVTITSATTDKPLLRLGTASNYFTLSRDAYGFLQANGSQTSPSDGYRGWGFDALELRTTSSPQAPSVSGRARIFWSGTFYQWLPYGGTLTNVLGATTTLTANRIQKATTNGILANSSITDDGSTVSTALPFSVNGGMNLATTNATGTGNLVKNTSPTLVTPNIGVATGTSLALGGGTALTTTNRTGTGNLALATSPSLTTPLLATPNIVSTAAPGSPASGDLWHDSTQKVLSARIDGMTQNLIGTIFTSTANATVANTTTETSLIGSGVGTNALPTNFFVAGKSIRITVKGIMSTTGTPNITIRLKLGSTVIVTTGAIATAGTISNNQFEAVITLTCRTTGAAGTVIANGVFTYQKSTHAPTSLDLVSTATVIIDTTAILALDEMFTWGTADALNTISGQVAVVEVLN